MVHQYAFVHQHAVWGVFIIFSIAATATGQQTCNSALKHASFVKQNGGKKLTLLNFVNRHAIVAGGGSLRKSTIYTPAMHTKMYFYSERLKLLI